jgi:hypothetical protein
MYNPILGQQSLYTRYVCSPSENLPLLDTFLGKVCRSESRCLPPWPGESNKASLGEYTSRPLPTSGKNSPLPSLPPPLRGIKQNT